MPKDLKGAERRNVILRKIVYRPGALPQAGRFPGLQFFPPRWIEWNQIELPLRGLPAAADGLRLLHLSDFHLRRRWPAILDSLLDCIQQDPPDLVLITGDFVDNKRNYCPGLPQVRRFVERLRARIGCYAIHGNHDHYEIGRELSDTPVCFLDGRRAVVEFAGGAIEVIGLPGKHRDELTPEVLASFPAKQPGIMRIVLSHYPDHLRRAGHLAADLFLAGHTHGGQICLPGGTALLWHDSLPRRFCRGVHRIGETWLVVSRGLGFTGLPLRAYATPEVLEIKLTAES